MLLRLQESPRADLILEVEAKSYVVDQWPSQRVEVRIGETELAEWSFDVKGNPGSRTARIPQSLFEGSSVAISFRMPDARSPASLGQGSDPRRLGLALISLRLVPAAV